MKKKWISLVIFCLVLFITACSNEYKPETTDVPDVAIMELIDLGNVPPEVVNVDRDPYLDSGIAYCFSAEEETFEEYEAEFKKKENSVILECEIADESTLLKYKHYGQCEEIYDIEDGQGDYWSKVITPVKILKIHHKGSSVETEIKVGDVLPYMEDYFKVTSDMEEVTQDYDVGTYITLKNYYPMMKGKRYVIYATIDDYEYRDLDYDVMLFPYDEESSVCLDEGALHAMRRILYDEIDIAHYVGAWLKYSGEDTFDYSYADVFADHEKAEFTVNHIDKSELKCFDSFQAKDEYFKKLDNVIIVYCRPVFDGQQVAKTEDNSLLADYEKFTMRSFIVEGVIYAGENIEEKNLKDKLINVCELYYEDEANEGTFITHNRYYPLEKMESGIMYAYVSEYEGDTVLIPAESIPVIPMQFSRYNLPENHQVLFGPKWIMQWYEYVNLNR